MTTKVEPMGIDTPVSSTSDGPKVVMRGGKNARYAKSSDLYLVSPMMGPINNIPQGTVGTLAPAVQRKFRRTILLIWTAVIAFSFGFEALLIHWDVSKARMMDMQDTAVMESLSSRCDPTRCSRMLAMVVVCVFGMALIGFLMWRCIDHSRLRVPMLMVCAFIMPWTFAAWDIWTLSRSAFFCQGLIFFGSLVLTLFSSLPIMPSHPTASHWLGTVISLGSTMILGVLIQEVILADNTYLILSPPPPAPLPPPPSPPPSPLPLAPPGMTYLAPPPLMPFPLGPPPPPPLPPSPLVEWTLPLVSQAHSYALALLFVFFIIGFVSFDSFKMRGLKPDEHMQVLRCPCSPARPRTSPRAPATTPPPRAPLLTAPLPQRPQAALFMFSDVLIITLLPFLVAFVCLLGGACEGACYEFDTAFKKPKGQTTNIDVAA